MSGDDWTVEDVAGLLKGPDGNLRKCCLLIGAGVSRSAGIGIGPDFISLIKDKYPRAFERAQAASHGTQPSYNQCMIQLTEADRATLVREQIESALINWAHIGIGRLENANCVDRILTTNFDPLASRACALFNRFPAIYDLAALRDADGSHAHVRYIPSFVSGSAIYHLHGQHTGFLLLNTETLLEEQAERIEPVLQDAVRGRVLIVCGYSGENDPLVARLGRQGGFPHGLIWVRHDDEDPCPAVCDTLLSKFGDCHVVRNKPADQFFTDLANELELQQPSFLTRPFYHMHEMLANIRPFSDVNAAEVDLLQQVRSRLAQADEQSSSESPHQDEISELMARASYEEILEKFLPKIANRSENERDLIADAALLAGNGLMVEAREASGEEADALYVRAAERFQSALTVNPRMHQALNNLGNALSDRAARKTGEEADALYKEAAEKYAESLKIKPDKASTLSNWATALMDQAKTADPELAKSLLNEAESKLQQARKIVPGEGSYNLACLHALRGNAKESARWLTQARDDNDLPSCPHILDDADFKLVRQTPEFLAALQEIGCA